MTNRKSIQIDCDEDESLNVVRTVTRFVLENLQRTDVDEPTELMCFRRYVEIDTRAAGIIKLSIRKEQNTQDVK